MNNWFKFHRNMFKNPMIMKDGETLAVWVWLLGNAAFGEKRVFFDRVDRELNSCELVTTAKTIANELKINESKVNRVLKMLENEKLIERQTTNRNTLIRVSNWEEYKSDEKQNEEQATNKRKTNDKQLKCNRQPDEERATATQEPKKQKKENDLQLLERLLPSYSFSEPLSEKVMEWIEYKVSRKEEYVEQGMKSLLKRISSKAQSNGDFAVMDLIDMSMANNWKGIIWDKLGAKNNREQDILDEWRRS